MEGGADAKDATVGCGDGRGIREFADSESESNSLEADYENYGEASMEDFALDTGRRMPYSRELKSVDEERNVDDEDLGVAQHHYLQQGGKDIYKLIRRVLFSHPETKPQVAPTLGGEPAGEPELRSLLSKRRFLDEQADAARGEPKARKKRSGQPQSLLDLDGFLWAIVGPCRSGKTTLIQHMIDTVFWQTQDYVFFFSPNNPNSNCQPGTARRYNSVWEEGENWFRKITWRLVKDILAWVAKEQAPRHETRVKGDDQVMTAQPQVQGGELVRKKAKVLFILDDTAFSLLSAMGGHTRYSWLEFFANRRHQHNDALSVSCLISCHRWIGTLSTHIRDHADQITLFNSGNATTQLLKNLQLKPSTIENILEWMRRQSARRQHAHCHLREWSRDIIGDDHSTLGYY